MSKSNRPEQAAGDVSTAGSSSIWRRVRILGIALVVALVPHAQAQIASAERAIADLEGCSEQERKKGSCINILKRESMGKGRIRIKAQVRGGRIIWYEFDQKSGSVRRAN